MNPRETSRNGAGALPPAKADGKGPKDSATETMRVNKTDIIEVPNKRISGVRQFITFASSLHTIDALKLLCAATHCCTRITCPKHHIDYQTVQFVTCW
jgi:hypothetical protein